MAIKPHNPLCETSVDNPDFFIMGYPKEYKDETIRFLEAETKRTEKRWLISFEITEERNDIIVVHHNICIKLLNAAFTCGFRYAKTIQDKYEV